MSTYEYKDFVYEWAPGQRGWVNIDSNFGGHTSVGARLEIWSWCQGVILPAIQEWIDDGWEPMTEVGPASIATRQYSRLNGVAYAIFSVVTMGVGLLLPFLFLTPVLEPVEFIVKMRRRKKS